MNDYLTIFLPIYLPIFLGLAGRASGYVPAGLAQGLQQFCLKITIPLLIFMSMASMDAATLSQVLTMTLALPLYMAVLWLFALGVTFLPLLRRHRAESILVIILGNIGYFGWAVTNIGIGPDALTRNLMFTTLYWPATIVFSILTRLVLDRSSEGVSAVIHILKVAVPILAAFVAGLALALLGVEVPAVLARPLNAFGDMTVPIILFGVGLTVSFRGHWGVLALLLPLRLLLALGAAWLTTRMLGALDGTSRAVILIVSQMPVGANSLIMADVMGLDEEFVSGAVTLSAVLALVTIPLTLLIFA